MALLGVDDGVGIQMCGKWRGILGWIKIKRRWFGGWR